MAACLAGEHFWTEKSKFENAERQYYEILNMDSPISIDVLPTECSNDSEISKKKKCKKNKSKNFITEDNSSIVPPDVYKNDGEPESDGVKKNMKKNQKKNKNSKKVIDTILDEKTQLLSMKSVDSVATNEESIPKCTVPSYNFRKNVISNKAKGTTNNSQCTLVSEIAKAREHIKNSLEKMDGIATLAATPISADALDRITVVEKDNADLKKLIENLKQLNVESQKRITLLESQVAKFSLNAATSTSTKKSEPKNDNDVDLFASDDDEENTEAARIREERLAAYAARKSKKPVLIAKSSLILDVKPWDDETDLKAMETEIRKIETDGLLWGASKLVPVAFGIQKLSISCVVEDEKVSIDWLTEEIEKHEDFIQSVDIAAFNKI